MKGNDKIGKIKNNNCRRCTRSWKNNHNWFFKKYCKTYQLIPFKWCKRLYHNRFRKEQKNVLWFIKLYEKYGELGHKPIVWPNFFSEENYCRLGKKEYSFTEVYNDLLEKFSKLDFEIFYFTLYLEDESLYEERLKREGKVEPAYAKFSGENSVAQQREYLRMADELQAQYPHIHVFKIENGKDLADTEAELKNILG